jgi:hypothetical protein
MPKFHKKPVVVEAVQYFRRNEFIEPQRSFPSLAICPNTNRDYVTTIHGERAHLEDGDWMILEPDGKHAYPCKPDIFEATYWPE